MKNCIQETYFIDPHSGEVLNFQNQSIVIQTLEQKAQAKRFFKLMQNKKEIDKTYQKYGNFIWNIYEVSQSQFPNIKASNIARLMFIATYVGYDGFLIDFNKHPLSKGQMSALLGLSEREFRCFYNEMITSGIMSIENDEIHLDKKTFTKGKISPKEIVRLAEKDKFITRLYIKGIRELYGKATAKSHKSLSYIFQILPFVNREYNIVCHNPLETILDDINPMTLGEFCDIINYDKSHATRLCNTLFEPRFKVKGKESSAMRYVVDTSFDKRTYKMFINPHVYYAGTRWKEVDVLGKF